MKVIGLTGGIGSGKSTVAQKLSSLGAAVFDADAVARKVIEPGNEGYAKVLAAFGRESIVTDDGTIDRSALAAVVFADKERLRFLETIIHGEVFRAARSFVAGGRQQHLQAVVLDIPLLLECGWQKEVDAVWLVVAHEEQQVKRAVLRSALPEEDIRKRMAAQMPLAAKKALATVIIDNTGSWAATEKQVVAAWEKIVAEG